MRRELEREVQEQREGEMCCDTRREGEVQTESIPGEGERERVRARCRAREVHRGREAQRARWRCAETAREGGAETDREREGCRLHNYSRIRRVKKGGRTQRRVYRFSHKKKRVYTCTEKMSTHRHCLAGRPRHS